MRDQSFSPPPPPINFTSPKQTPPPIVPLPSPGAPPKALVPPHHRRARPASTLAPSDRMYSSTANLFHRPPNLPTPINKTHRSGFFNSSQIPSLPPPLSAGSQVKSKPGELPRGRPAKSKGIKPQDPKSPTIIPQLPLPAANKGLNPSGVPLPPRVCPPEGSAQHPRTGLIAVPRQVMTTTASLPVKIVVKSASGFSKSRIQPYVSLTQSPKEESETQHTTPPSQSTKGKVVWESGFDISVTPQKSTWFFFLRALKKHNTVTLAKFYLHIHSMRTLESNRPVILELTDMEDGKYTLELQVEAVDWSPSVSEPSSVPSLTPRNQQSRRERKRRERPLSNLLGFSAKAVSPKVERGIGESRLKEVESPRADLEDEDEGKRRKRRFSIVRTKLNKKIENRPSPEDETVRKFSQKAE
eukprot:CAMPEP_0201493098 /NCGR_PEP_ID=MMETSP0151_2-20130828/36135_1 /ASSEMBLY_ACC=CAM_ASM_000257 /TAXON_ID=200890 /ORGANISM="Paramoeba atlantica, Strain 621/1 / CCAP 1560/9" /LENGTH=412 /DNA_ID=CAMNT_0047880267 /DNA_START=401 /DNA_END=1639 /DNA_ORIENTATION=+